MTPSRRTFIKQVGIGIAGALVLPALPGCRTRTPAGQGRSLPRSTPEAEGITSAGIVDFLEAVERGKPEWHSFMLVRHGRVVAEGWWAPYASEFKHTMYSMSKSFTSTAVGFAVAEGKLSVEDPVVSFFPNDLPETVSENLAALKVKHLLTMSVGDEKEPTHDMVEQENWVKTFLAAPITHPPGATFMYNSGATYMLSAIVQQRTGQRIVDYLMPRLFQPLGIEGVTWETCPRGINTGGWGLSIQTEGLARFGQLYLRNGVWRGRQVLPAAWAREATTFKIQQPAPPKPNRPNADNDWLQGYCYQFWRCRHNAFRGDGAYGQFTIVMPEQEAVVAITSENPDMQGQLDLVWKHLLPAMHEKPLPVDTASQRQLQQKLSTLALAVPSGQAASPLAERISGRVFKFTGNDLGLESATFSSQEKVCTFTATDREGRAHAITCGFDAWHRGETALPGTPPRLVSGGAPKPGTPSKVAGRTAWKDDRTLELLLRYYETPHHDTVTCRFDQDRLELRFVSSIAQMSTPVNDKRPVLQGTIS